MRRDFTFFIDRGLGTKIVPKAIVAAGYKVVVHDDMFAPTVKDEEWLTRIGELGYVFISKDEHIERRPQEVLALMQANVHGFVLYSSNTTLIGLVIRELQ